MVDEAAFIEKYGEVLGRGKTALICGTDEVASKIFVEGIGKTEIFHEAFLMAIVEMCQIPAPRVYGVEKCGDRYVLRMSRAKGTSLLDLFSMGKITVEECVDYLVSLQVKLHHIHIDSSRLSSMNGIFRENISINPRLTDTEKQELLEMLERMPCGNSFCHGDFHIGNIQLDNDSCTILDWAEVSSGPAAADACRTYLDIRYLGKYMIEDEQALEEMAKQYMEKYTAATGISQEEILAWLPLVTGALYGFVQDERVNQELYNLLHQKNPA